MNGLEFCPVCWRLISVSNHQTAMAHSDKADRACPFSGQPMGGRELPESIWRRAA